ncbi:MAG: hypothetical protein AAF927_31725 [Bacteroidota bacterium]
MDDDEHENFMACGFSKLLVQLGETSMAIKIRNPGKEREIDNYVYDFLKNELHEYSTWPEKIRALDEFGEKIMALHDSLKTPVKS